MSEPISKKRKIKIASENEGKNNDENEQSRREQEEALFALIEHRTKEVEHNRIRLAYYKLQLEESEKRLEDAQLKLARSRSRSTSSANSFRNIEDSEPESESPSIEHVDEGHPLTLDQPKPEHLQKVTTLSKISDMIESGSAIISTSKKPSDNSLKEIKLEECSPIAPRIHESSFKSSQSKKPHPPQEVVNSARNCEKPDSGSASFSRHSKSSSQHQPRIKSQLIIPGKPSQPVKKYDSRPRESVSPDEPVKAYDSRPRASVSPNQAVKTNDSRPGASVSHNPQSSISNSVNGSRMVKQEEDFPHRKSPEQEAFESRAKGMKRTPAQKENQELIPLVCTKPSPTMISCQTSSLLCSQHKRKLRSLELCPANDQLFATSALDGVVNLWQIQGKGLSANLLSTMDFVSAKKRWPEDIAWHPDGNSLFSVYTADGNDTQVSILNLNQTNEKNRVISVAEKPHTKGIINNIMFMPWEKTCFVTGGNDHAVVLWSEKDGENSWKPNVIHRNMHSSAVMGVAGLQQKKMVLSAGADKRVFGFDLTAGKSDYKLHIESKCMSILPNPCDFNMFMIQTGAPERQLKLCDIRTKHIVLHEFGWKQESSESQSALISQSWSPDGFYITSGSADPVIHLFDIRYNSQDPCQSIKAHQKRVFKAMWHYALPLLISISSDLNIGLHKIS